MHVSTVQQVIVFIYGIGLVLSCQIQDDLSLYYNMVAANSKGPKMQGKSVQTKGTTTTTNLVDSMATEGIKCQPMATSHRDIHTRQSPPRSYVDLPQMVQNTNNTG